MRLQSTSVLDSRRAPDELDNWVERVREEPVDDSKTAREQRLAAALRANLHRRKQQARERSRAESDDPENSRNASSEGPDPSGSGSKS